MKPLWIVKIGGSVLTDKSVTDRITVQNETVADLAKVLAQYTDQYQFIVVHGAGGYIHALAKQYNLKQGMDAHVNSHTGLDLIHQASQELNSQFIKLSQQQGLDAQPVHSKNVVIQNQGVLESIDLQAVQAVIENKQIPVLYGEMVPDRAWQYSVCSGDSIISYLVSKLPVARLIFLTDVDGIYTQDPHLSDNAQLIEEISVGSALDGSIQLDGSHNTDVTGGLRGKIESCANLFENPNLESIHITNGKRTHNLKRVLNNTPFPHTTLIS